MAASNRLARILFSVVFCRFRSRTPGDERAAMAMSAPLETVGDPMICAFFEPTALRILKSSGQIAWRPAMSMVNASIR